MQHIFPFIHAQRNPKAHTTTEKAAASSKEALKSANAFLSRSEDFGIAVRTIRPNRIGSYHMSHLFRVYQTKIFRLLDLELNVDLEMQLTTENRNAKVIKMIIRQRFHEFFLLRCEIWHFCRIKRVFLRNENVRYNELTVNIEIV